MSSDHLYYCHLRLGQNTRKSIQTFHDNLFWYHKACKKFIPAVWFEFRTTMLHKPVTIHQLFLTITSCSIICLFSTISISCMFGILLSKSRIFSLFDKRFLSRRRCSLSFAICSCLTRSFCSLRKQKQLFLLFSEHSLEIAMIEDFDQIFASWVWLLHLNRIITFISINFWSRSFK